MAVDSYLLMVLQLMLLPSLSQAGILSAFGGGGASQCKDPASCQNHMQKLIETLDAQKTEMSGKDMVLDSLESLRNGILSGDRIELPTVHRQHLEKNSPLVSDISYDAKHKPLSTNTSRHLRLMRIIAPEVDVNIHTIMPLKRPSGQKIGPSALLVSIDTENRMWIHTFEGDLRLSKFELGHGEGMKITSLVMSPNQDNHFAVTADDGGNVRVHTLKVIAKKAEQEVWNASGKETEDQVEEADEKPEEKFEQKHGIKQLVVTANFSCEFSIPPSTKTGEARKLTTVLPVDRGSQILFITGDSLGGVGVFHRNGTLKGRVKVTEDPGGVKGLMRGQGQTVLFFSSHSFGFLSVSQVDVQYPPCTGWNSPLFDIAPDPGLSYSRVVLALSDGDVLVFSTTRGKNKVCDLTLKFPKISSLPFKLQMFRGHVIGLPTPFDSTPRKDEYLRELHFFNIAEMDAGYGAAPTRVLTLQADFKPQRPHAFSLHSSTGGGADRAKVQMAMHFQNESGIALYELNLKTPAPPKAVAEGGSWLDWFPKVGVFGIAMVGVVIWNVRKMSGGGGGGSGGGGGDDMGDFDFSGMGGGDLKERLRKGGLGGKKGGLGGLGGAGGGGLGGLGDDDDDM